ncbi:GNAT family N-acetyltransferase [Fictibacillus nanhaiensis]|uniref:GNAT family N-acetyltransferase n=1 Tax=Fictibacillus nanhaiensis TaxID=742169 RepID=A0ABS2ZMD3_9BACL|nr:GNAT family N-acetyltransferase [Fictibacillus nanhaiensis]
MQFQIKRSFQLNSFKDLSLEFIKSLDDVCEHELFPLCKDRSFYVSRPWLLAIERLRGGDTGYIVCRNQTGQLLGLLPIYWGKPSSRGLYEPYKRFLERSGGHFHQKDWTPTVIIGSRAAYTCEFLINPNINNEAEESRVLESMIEAANIFTKNQGATSISCLYMNEKGRRQLHDVIEDKNNFFIVGANAVLDIEFNSIEEYQDYIKWRRGIRRERSIFDAKGYTVDSSKLGDSMQIFAQLFANHENKYGHNTSAENEIKELQILKDTANDFSHVIYLKREDVVVGCVLLFLWGKTIYARTVGFDFNVVGDGYEYFNLAYYEVIRFAILNGYKHVEYGMGTYRAKLKRGARLEPLWGYICSNSQPSPLNNSIFKDWDHERYHAVKTANISELERIEFP